MKRTICIPTMMLLLVTLACAMNVAYGSVALNGDPAFGIDDCGGWTFTDSTKDVNGNACIGNNWITFGFDLDLWAELNGNAGNILQAQLNAAHDCNANTVTLQIPWAAIERDPASPGSYSSDWLTNYLNLAMDSSYDLKHILVLWIGTNFAGGNQSCVPAYYLGGGYTWVVTGTNDSTHVTSATKVQVGSCITFQSGVNCGKWAVVTAVSGTGPYVYTLLAGSNQTLSAPSVNDTFTFTPESGTITGCTVVSGTNDRTDVTSNASATKDSGLVTGATITFTSGQNRGWRPVIIAISGTGPYVCTLNQTLPVSPAPGDTFIVSRPAEVAVYVASNVANSTTTVYSTTPLTTGSPMKFRAGTSGNIGQQRTISAAEYVASSGQYKYTLNSALPATPCTGDEFHVYTGSFYHHMSGNLVGVPWNCVDPRCNATKSAESAAYAQMVAWIKDYNSQSATRNVVLAVEPSAEMGYLSAAGNTGSDFTNWAERCDCPDCHADYIATYGANDTTHYVEFEKTKFADYIKGMVDAGAAQYDIPTINQVCPKSWWGGCQQPPNYNTAGDWRYNEDPGVIKSTVNRTNSITCPSVAGVRRIQDFQSDMADFQSIYGDSKRAFSDGINAAGYYYGPWNETDPQIACAPWDSTLYYGGLGSLYFDIGTNLTGVIQDTSIATSTNPSTGKTMYNKFKKQFGPLKGGQYQIARMKSNGTTDFKFWWQPGGGSPTYGYFTGAQNVQVNHWPGTYNNDFGYAFQLGEHDFCFGGSTWGNGSGNDAYCIDLIDYRATNPWSASSGYQKYLFEKGYFHPVTGAWVKTGDVSGSVSISGANNRIAELAVYGDSSDATGAVYRFHNYDQAGSYYYRIKSTVNGEYLNTQNWYTWSSIGRVGSGNLWAQNNWDDQFSLTSTGSGQFYMTVRDTTSHGTVYLFMDNTGSINYVQWGTTKPAADTKAQWKLVSDGNGNYGIQNVYYGKYIWEASGTAWISDTVQGWSLEEVQ